MSFSTTFVWTKPVHRVQEVWKPCPGFEATHEISNLGRLRSVDRIVHTRRGSQVKRGRVLALDYTHPNGYARAVLYAGGRCTKKTVHVLVVLAFHGRPPGPIGTRRGEYTVDHLDGDKTNNRADNLEWVTSDENRRRYVDRGTIKRGAAHPNAKLTAATVRMIRRLYATGRHTQGALAKRFGVSASHVSQVVRRVAWKHV